MIGTVKPKLGSHSVLTGKRRYQKSFFLLTTLIKLYEMVT